MTELGITYHAHEKVTTELSHARLNKLCEALKSAEYTQTSGVLERIDLVTHEPVGNCCLGVAAREAIKMGLPVDVHLDLISGTTYFNDNNETLHESIYKFYGFEDGNPTVPIPQPPKWSDELTLAQLNDDGFHDLPVMADIIRRTFIGS